MYSPALTPANQGRRVVGYLIDLVISTVAIFAVLFIVGIVLYILLPARQVGVLANALDQSGRAASFVAAFLYYTPCWALFGRTPGMALLGIHVVSRLNP